MRCSRLAVMESRRGLNFLENLAAAPSAFLSEIQLPFWKRWLHTCKYNFTRVCSIASSYITNMFHKLFKYKNVINKNVKTRVTT